MIDLLIRGGTVVIHKDAAARLGISMKGAPGALANGGAATPGVQGVKRPMPTPAGATALRR